MSNLVLSSKHAAAGSLTQGARNATARLVQAARNAEADLVTNFTSVPTGRIFNARFSDRFKKS